MPYRFRDIGMQRVAPDFVSSADVCYILAAFTALARQI